MPAELYTEADVELVAQAMYEEDESTTPAGWYVPWAGASKHTWKAYRWRARAALTALAEAGRLLPEGWTVREQFGVCADEQEPLTVLPEESRETAEERIAEEQPQWPDVTLRLMSRMVSDWREVGQPLSPEAPCDRTDLPEQSDMRCPCGFAAGEHPAWIRRYCRNRRYPEHGAVSPCAICGYQRP